MPNPYSYKGAISEGDAFYGREGVMAKIYARIGAQRPQSISVVGEPKIGKTSLLWRLYAEESRRKYLEDPERYIYVFMRLKEERAGNPDAFFVLLCEKIREQEGSLVGAEMDPSYDCIGQIAEDLRRKEMNLILFLDDFNIVTQDPDFPVEFFSFLRSIANNYNVAYITSSHQELQTLCVSKAVGESPFFNIFTNMPLKPFKQEELARLVEEPSQREGVPLKEYMDAVTDLGGYVPYLDQIACSLLFEANASGGAIGRGEMEEIRERFMAEVDVYYRSVWEGFGVEEQEVCRAALTTGRVVPQVEYRARELERRGYLVERDGRYRLFCSSFRVFVARESDMEVSWEERGGGVAGWFKTIFGRE